MSRPISFSFQILFLLLLSLAFAVPRNVLGQDHVVTSSDLQKDVAGASHTRQKNLEQVEGFVSSPEAQQAMKSAHIDSRQVKDGVSQLSDDDLARLSARSEKAQRDFAAGRLSDRDLIIIVVVIAALILIIVAVH
jgi:hypothetical protein